MSKVLLFQDGSALHFHCPGCGFGHMVYIKKVEQYDLWTWNGSFDKPTIRASVKVQYGDGKVCHSLVTDGRIQFLGDCTHSLVNQTVDLPDA